MGATPARCEYNPRLRVPAIFPPRDSDCDEEATVSVGQYGAWHLCAACAGMTKFKRFTVRRELR